jgi:hypothetical protein
VEINVVREQYRPESTIGRLFVDGHFECYTLEDGIRTNKVYGRTAIPAGRYTVEINYSPAFKKPLPILRNVPKFEGVRIHPGNTPENTLGCILVGRNWQPGAEQIAASRVAFGPLMTKIQAALQRGEQVLLRIIQENAPAELAAREFRMPGIRPARATAKPKPKRKHAKAKRKAGAAKANPARATTGTRKKSTTGASRRRPPSKPSTGKLVRKGKTRRAKSVARTRTSRAKVGKGTI